MPALSKLLHPSRLGQQPIIDSSTMESPSRFCSWRSGGSPALLNLFNALAKGNDDPLDSSDDESLSETESVTRPTTSGTSSTTVPPPSSTNTTTTTTTSASPSVSLNEDGNAHQMRGDKHVRDSQERGGVGEWIGPIELPHSSSLSTSDIPPPLQPSSKPTHNPYPTHPYTGTEHIAVPTFFRVPSRDQDELSHRLAVLAVNNYSDLTNGLNEEWDAAENSDRREEIHETEDRLRDLLKNSTQEEIKAQLSASVEARTEGRARRGTLTHSPERMPSGSSGDTYDEVLEPGDAVLTQEEKLAAIQEEFGDIDTLMVGEEKEKLVAESIGTLFRGILIIGNIHLTTHRLTFHAMMPPPHQAQGENASGILHSGPVTIHRKHSLVGIKHHRVWMELTSEMCTTYPSADDEGRVRPIRSVLLASIRKLYPMDSEKPCDIRAKYSTPEGDTHIHFTLDTVESAFEWHRQFEAALFEYGRARRYQKRLARMRSEAGNDPAKAAAIELEQEQDQGWEMLKVCIPLDRIANARCEDYFDFAKILDVDVDVDDQDGTGKVLQQMKQWDDIAPITWPKDSRNVARKETKVVASPSESENEEPDNAKPPKRTGSFSLFRNKTRTSKTLPPGMSTPPVSSPLATMDTDSIRSVPVTAAEVDNKRCSFRRSRPTIELGPAVGDGSALDLGDDAIPRGIRTHSGLSSITTTSMGTTDTDDHLTTTPTQLTVSTEPTPSSSINVKFGVLDDRMKFGMVFHEVMKEVEGPNRKYKEGKHSPMPTLDIGKCSVLDLAAAEGGISKHGIIRPGHGDPMLPASQADFFGQEEAEDSSDSDEPDEKTTGKAAAKAKSQALSKRKTAARAKVVFGIPEEDDVWIKRCYISRTVPARGHIILTKRFLCFWRKTLPPASDVKYRFDVHELKAAYKSQAFRIRANGLTVQISGYNDLRFEFWSSRARDEALVHINELIAGHAKEHSEAKHDSVPSSPRVFPADGEIHSRAQSFSLVNRALSVNTTTTSDSEHATSTEEGSGATSPSSPLTPWSSRTASEKRKSTDLLGAIKFGKNAKVLPDDLVRHVPIIINKPGREARNIRARTFGLLTIGSRGDVQPYIALALRLQHDGHRVVIVTHDEFKVWIEGYGIEHRQAGGDPAALMKLSLEHSMLSPGFFKESLGGFRKWLDDMLHDSWVACHDVDVIVESPSMMCGVHIAEARKIPYFRAFTMPWTRTATYPQAFMVPSVEMGPAFNYSTYVLFDNIIWKATAPQINKWRKRQLKIGPTDMSHLSQTKVPFMYNFSSAIVPRPLDWHDDITITGYWNLENSDAEWTPPDSLVAFMDKARADGRPLVYIGFGSIVVPDPNELTRNIIKGVEKSDVRAIIAKGWSSRGVDPAKQGEDIIFPDSCYSVDKIPHGWLFPKIDVALHHGGAGTVGASLRAGLPTLIKPWFGDQFFWVTKLGVGLKVSGISPEDFADALKKATKDRVMIERAGKAGERIRSEDGVGNAVKYMYSNLMRAGMDRTQLQWAK